MYKAQRHAHNPSPDYKSKAFDLRSLHYRHIILEQWYEWYTTGADGSRASVFEVRRTTLNAQGPGISSIVCSLMFLTYFEKHYTLLQVFNPHTQEYGLMELHGRNDRK